eukprot:7007222-Prymnesium_polylepis.1
MDHVAAPPPLTAVRVRVRREKRAGVQGGALSSMRLHPKSAGAHTSAPLLVTLAGGWSYDHGACRTVLRFLT